jgi:predicted secreted protein
MRRFDHAAAFLAGLATLPLPGAVAADPAPAETEIHLTEQATRMVAPDRLRAVLRIEAKGASGRQVQADVNRRMEAALAKAKSRADVTAETGSYGVSRDFSVKGSEAWIASETLTLSAQDFAAVLTLVGELQSDGLLMTSLQFYLAAETLKAAESALTAAALAALRARAQDVAKDLGMAVDRYKSITIGNAGDGPRPIPLARFSAASASAPAMPPPVAEAGEETVSLAVNADIVLVPGKP